MFENGASLFGRYAGKPLHELGNLRAILEVLEQRGDGYARTVEHPGSADTPRIPFDSGASRPVDHELYNSIDTFREP